LATSAVVGSLAAAQARQPAAGASPASGGSITFGLEAESTNGWCPASARLSLAGIQVAGAVYDTLVVPNGRGEVVPYLARSVDHDATYQRWTIGLRNGVTFHDGTRLSAEIVKANLDAYRRNPLLGAGLTDIADVEVTGVDEVTVTTARPWVAFPWFLYNDGRLVIVAPAQLADPQGCATRLIGTGPFVLDRWRVNEELVVTRYPDYWRRDARGRSLPYLDRIEFVPVADGAQRVVQLEGGALDVIHTSDGRLVSELTGRRSRFRYVREPRGRRGVRYYLLNVRTPPLDDGVARAAIASAIDRDEINEIRNRSAFDVADGPFDEGVAGNLENPGYPEHDPARAERLVREYKAAHDGRFSVTLGSSNDSAELAEAQLVQAQLRAVGIDAALTSGDQSTIVALAASGQFSILLWRSLPGNDPDMNYPWWSTGSALNFGRFDDPRLQDLLERGRSEPDATTRARIYEDVNRELASQLFHLWAYHPQWVAAAQPRVRGLRGLPLPGDAGTPAFSGRLSLAGLSVTD
jgi:peptide/nickel transport system substrate-binding protein